MTESCCAPACSSKDGSLDAHIPLHQSARNHTPEVRRMRRIHVACASSSPTSRITTSARSNARRVTERSLRSSNTDRLPNLKTTTGHQRFFSRWLTSRRVSMQREISFYSDRYRKHVSGIWSVFGGRITVTAPDGRQQTTHVGSSTPETLARLMLIEIEGQRRRS